MSRVVNNPRIFAPQNSQQIKQVNIRQDPKVKLLFQYWANNFIYKDIPNDEKGNWFIQNLRNNDTCGKDDWAKTYLWSIPMQRQSGNNKNSENYGSQGYWIIRKKESKYPETTSGCRIGSKVTYAGKSRRNKSKSRRNKSKPRRNKSKSRKL
jgi:hypothetical protein